MEKTTRQRVALAVAVGGLVVAVGGLAVGQQVASQEVVTHVVTLSLDWGAGSEVITGTEPITITHNVVMVEMRTKAGDALAMQSGSVGDCEPVYGPDEPPEVGLCGTALTFTFTLPYRGYWEEWGKAVFVDVNENVYSVPFSGALAVDERGFSLIGILEEATPTPTSTLTPTPTSTLTPTLTSTLTPTPTSTPTLVPLAGFYRELAARHRELAILYDQLASELEK